jgi:serine/threonine protein kinase
VSVSRVGLVVWMAGTPQWMAPEVMEGHCYSNKVDVYSFGIVLCELMSRITPFSGRRPVLGQGSPPPPTLSRMTSAVVGAFCAGPRPSAGFLVLIRNLYLGLFVSADVYRRFDFIDAVLEEGAMPTIPLWCDASACSRRPESQGSGTSAAGRPSVDGGESGSESDGDGGHRRSSVSLGRGSYADGDLSAPALSALEGSTSDGVSTIEQSWSRFDSEVRAFEAAVRRDVVAVLNAPLTATTLTLSALLGLHPPSRWEVLVGDCTGVLKLIIEACLNRSVAPFVPCLHCMLRVVSLPSVTMPRWPSLALVVSPLA